MAAFMAAPLLLLMSAAVVLAAVPVTSPTAPTLFSSGGCTAKACANQTCTKTAGWDEFPFEYLVGQTCAPVINIGRKLLTYSDRRLMVGGPVGVGSGTTTVATTPQWSSPTTFPSCSNEFTIHNGYVFDQKTVAAGTWLYVHLDIHIKNGWKNGDTLTIAKAYVTEVPGYLGSTGIVVPDTVITFLDAAPAGGSVSFSSKGWAVLIPTSDGTDRVFGGGWMVHVTDDISHCNPTYHATAYSNTGAGAHIQAQAGAAIYDVGANANNPPSIVDANNWRLKPALQLTPLSPGDSSQSGDPMNTAIEALVLPGAKGASRNNLGGSWTQTVNVIPCVNAPVCNTKKTPQDCCSLCAATPGCVTWQFYPSGYSSATSPMPIPGQQCYLLGSKDTPASRLNASETGLSTVGGNCNPTITNDPHLVGAHGTEFEFNGELSKAFCLVTDHLFHINILLDGYDDPTAVLVDSEGHKDGKPLRSWIKDVGIVFSKGGEEHTIVLSSRRGVEVARGAGFLAQVLFDNASTAIPALHETLTLPGGFSLTYSAQETKGPYDVDVFSLTVEGLLTLEVRLRPAHKLLRRPDDAKVHINLGLTDMKTSSDVHGVLGQTYRPGAEREERAAKYKALSALLGHNIHADGASGAGFLDGRLEDYISSSVSAVDCKVTKYEGVKSENIVLALATEGVE